MRHSLAAFAFLATACASPPKPAFVLPPAPAAKTVVPAPRDGESWARRHAAQKAAALAGGNKLVFVGDSITQGWEGAGKEAWAAAWQQHGALNLGIGGDGTQHVLWRLDDGVLAALAQPNNDVRAVVVMIGTNNSNGAQHTALEIAHGVVAVVQRLRTGLPDAKVLLLAIFPRGERPNAQREKNAEASRLAAAALAHDAMVVPCDIGPRFLTADGVLTKDVMPDALHLSPAAYRTWADAIAPQVDAMLR